ncbi:MAG: prepilin peptidase, partial [Lentisphaeria bacterium]|nr:prepilin peptidase [Lentisphaeria bacterium]
WRVPRGMSVVSPPSHCPNCGHQIRAWENIPIVSWLLLGGKCSSCRKGISARYILVELMIGLLYAGIFLLVVTRALPGTTLLFYWIFASIVVCSGFTDCETSIIPDEFTCLAMALGLILSPLCPGYWHLESRVGALLLSLLSCGCAGGLMALCALAGKKIFKREALGWGDVKLIAGAGAMLGLRGALFMVAAGCFAALLLFPLVRLLIPKYRKRRTLKFGPFLAIGALLYMALGSSPFLEAWIRKLSF